MDYQLPKKWIESLSKQPETGMGYQIVDLYLLDKKEPIRGVKIFNGSEFQLPAEDFDVKSITDIVLAKK